MEARDLFCARYRSGVSPTYAGMLGTRAVLIGVAAVTAAQFAFIDLQLFRYLFESRDIPFSDGPVIVMVGILRIIVVEMEKRIASAAAKRRRTAA